MKEYRLKKGMESFQVVDGPMAGRKFLKGEVYTEIPPGEVRKFDEIKPKPSVPVPAKEDNRAGKQEKKEE